MTLQDVKHSEQDIIVRTLDQDGNQDTGRVEHGKYMKKVINEQISLSQLPLDIKRAIEKLQQTYKVKVDDSHIKSELSQEGGYYPDAKGEKPEARKSINQLVSKIHELFPKTRNLGVISGYRGYFKQADTFGSKVASQGGVANRQKNVTLPGFSQHHTGKAFDILSVEPTWWDSNPEVKKWVANNVGNYGFKVSYPKPGVLRNEEPWHLYYIGGDKKNMENVVSMKESDLSRLVKRIINEDDNRRSAYGQEIRNLEKDLASDEDIQLSDYSGRLRGDVVKKKDYVIHMLRDAIDKQEWGQVGDVILYIKHRM
jgi:LAS superfamily LD-carboxypeptidase LdcB